MKIKLTKVEIGYAFITIYGYPYEPMKELYRKVVEALPNKESEIQQDVESETVFHPNGRIDSNKHFHILYDHKPTDWDINYVKSMLAVFGIPHAQIPFVKMPDGDLTMAKQGYRGLDRRFDNIEI